jgi:hypothetical protein
MFTRTDEFVMTRGTTASGSQLVVITSWQQMIGQASRSTMSEP